MLRTAVEHPRHPDHGVAALGSISLLVGSVGIVTINDHRGGRADQRGGPDGGAGQRARTILGLFLGEAVVLAVLGGLMGLAVGLGLAQLLRIAVPALPVQTPVLYACWRSRQRADRPGRRRAAGAPGFAPRPGRGAAGGVGRVGIRAGVMQSGGRSP